MFASFYEKKFINIPSRETLIRTIEREYHCCGFETSEEYWNYTHFLHVRLISSISQFEYDSFLSYLQTDWALTAYRETGLLYAYPPNCCENCFLEATNISLTISTIIWQPEHLGILKDSLGNITLNGTKCNFEVDDLQTKQLYTLCAYTALMFLLSGSVCVCVCMRNFCQWITEGVDEEKYIEELQAGRQLRDKLRNRKRMLSEDSNLTNTTAIGAGNFHNRLATRAQMTRYVPAHKAKPDRSRCGCTKGEVQNNS
ncbi:unnamed protein product [Anisakis simplex]|uniref:Uncharacterized protein n=1 Tax=Anisakis simplex TaxID=6269 RepID=A0A0M3J2Z2_ANISI|nr:unnamed protein product [Anisakis simplex]